MSPKSLDGVRRNCHTIWKSRFCAARMVELLPMTATYVSPKVLVSLDVSEIVAEAFGGSGSQGEVPVVCGLTNVTGKH